MTSSLRSARGLLLVVGVAAGMVVSLGGCNGPLKRLRNRDNQPVNTALGNISNENPVKLPDEDELISREDSEFGSVHDQIQESARQLNVYFANLEIDGVSETDGVREKPAPSFDIEAEYQQAIDDKPVNQPVAPSAYDTNEGDDGVRISLLGAGDDTGESTTAEEEMNIADAVKQPSIEGDQRDEEKKEEPVEEGDVEDLPEPVVVEDIEIDPIVRKEELVRELAAILATLANTSDDPGSAALALASLETLLPEDVDSLIDEGVLSEAERTSLDAARLFLRSLSSEGSISSPSEVASQLEEIQAQLSAWAGVTIKKAALCTRVDGYGWYETFPSYRFIAGRAQAVIVYVELERFAQREFTGPDGQPRYETKLSQRLELYHVADDLNTWNRQAETVTGETRNRLRDYYLTNQITLPANLGVGRYHLKVVMRDLIGERVAETIIPIEIVAR